MSMFNDDAANVADTDAGITADDSQLPDLEAAIELEEEIELQDQDGDEGIFSDED